MIRIINGLKYDTNKMELIAKYTYGSFSICFGICNKTCEIYKSKKGRYLQIENGIWSPILEDCVKRKLMSHNVAAYEKMFGEVEEA